MEFKIGNVTLFLPPLWMTIIIIISVFIIIRWSKRSGVKPMTLFLYFLISTVSIPLFGVGKFIVPIPIGFLAVWSYLHNSERYHASKMRASIVGLFFVLYQTISKYIG